MDEELINSIAAQAPHMKPNDTVFVSRDLWWTVVSEHKSSDGHLVTSGPPGMRKIGPGPASGPPGDGLLWYGTGLSIWSLLANGLLLIVILTGLIRGRINQVDVPHRCFLLNHVTVQILTSSLVVAVMVVVERFEGGWQWGGDTCRLWIIVRLLLAGVNFWSLLSVVFDRFINVVAASTYSGWAAGRPTGGGCCRRLLIVAVVIATTWLSASLALVPTFAAIHKPDFVLEQVCAVNLRPANVLFISVSSFAVPASLVLIVSLAIILARRRNDVIPGEHPGKPPVAVDYSRFGPVAELPHDYDVIDDVRNVPGRHVTTGTGVSCVEGWCCMLAWCPFYSLGVATAFCSSTNPMCVNADVWKLLSWLGHTTLAVVPVIWLTGDAKLRSLAGRVLIPSACQHPAEHANDQVLQGSHCNTSTTGSVGSTQFTTVDRPLR